jgi:hypothetical protein
MRDVKKKHMSLPGAPAYGGWGRRVGQPLKRVWRVAHLGDFVFPVSLQKLPEVVL